MSADLMIDLSSNNPPPDLDVLWHAGYRVLALKATESTSYAWATAVTYAAKWHERGGVVWWYHFARPGHAEDQARFFVAHVKAHAKAGDRLVLDLEVPGVDGAFEDAFWHTVRPLCDLPDEDYGPPYFLRDHGIRPDHGVGLWLADYSAKPSLIPPGWRHYDAWQFSDHATVPGESRPVDESRLAPSVVPGDKPTHPEHGHAHTPAHKPPHPDARPTVRRGDGGENVRSAQVALNRHGARLKADGVFGAATEVAVKAFQRKHKLAADGVVGPTTWKALES